MEKSIYNKNGQLSSYGFLCGYVQRKETDKMWIKMYFEHYHFHVMCGYVGSGFLIWECFECFELTKARNYYRYLCNNSKYGKIITE